MTNEQLAVLLMALVNDLRDAVSRAETEYENEIRGLDLVPNPHLFDEMKTFLRTFTHFRNELKGNNS